MDINGRFNHIEDVLVRLHLNAGGWWGWTDVRNKIYANLEIYNSDYDKPTEESLTDALAKHQSDFDAQAYARNRQAEYPYWGTQLNKIYDDGLTKWKSEMVDPVKTKWPKDNSGPVE